MIINSSKPRTVLHIGWGFMPWRGGGLIEYAEDLMQTQTVHGLKVYYFCSGRQYIPNSDPYLKIHENNGITFFEIINSRIIHSIYNGTLNPELEMNEISSENFFRNILSRTMPDIVHIHELAGLPSSLIEIAREEYNIPTIMTLADYFLLCPTIMLYDHNEQNCTEMEVGEKCILCCMNAPSGNKHLLTSTFKYELIKFSSYFLPSAFIDSMIKLKSRIFDYNFNKSTRPAKSSVNKGEKVQYAETYQKRRNTNLKRLKKINVLIARSDRLKEIYQRYTGNDLEIVKITPTLTHFRSIKTKKIDKLEFPIQIATLNGLSSVAKGSKLLINTLKILKKNGYEDLFDLHVYGTVGENITVQLQPFRNVQHHGTYKRYELNDILEKIDVGLIPSVWEEAFGYVGLEFLAKGIPIIGNNVGGINEYLIDNKTGLLNSSLNPQGFAERIATVLKEPEILLYLNRYIRTNNEHIVKNIEKHFLEIQQIYEQFV